MGSASQRASARQPASAAPLSFTTPPRLGDPAPFRFAFWADMGVLHATESQRLLAAWAANGALDVAHHGGDISYADNRLDGSVPSHNATPKEYNGILGEFYNQMEPMATSIPYMLGVGNHEWPCDYSEYELRQRAMPYLASGAPWSDANASGKNFYYSFRFSGHF